MSTIGAQAGEEQENVDVDVEGERDDLTLLGNVVIAADQRFTIVILRLKL